MTALLKRKRKEKIKAKLKTMVPMFALQAPHEHECAPFVTGGRMSQGAREEVT